MPSLGGKRPRGFGNGIWLGTFVAAGLDDGCAMVRTFCIRNVIL
uniref:Uncharacterized protein n=1 Tax=Rhizophora mucronata TaxID=61149 RepID=A0A2P2QFP6_RHIMU